MHVQFEDGANIPSSKKHEYKNVFRYANAQLVLHTEMCFSALNNRSPI